MPSAAEVAAYRRAQQAVSAAARGHLASFWAGLDVWEVVQVREALEVFFPALVTQYGDAAAALAAEWFEGLTGAQATLGSSVAEAAANARMRWALGGILNGDPVQALAAVQAVLDNLVRGQGRETISASARDNGIGYARVPSGTETCVWCLILASRGAVYETRETAKFKRNGDKYHNDCDCEAVPIRDDRDLPKGYDPDALYRQYQAARDAAGSGSIKKITAQMREDAPGSH